MTRRAQHARRDRARAQLEAEVLPYALALVDGSAPVPVLRPRAALALAALLSRYARAVSGEARKRIARYFEGAGLVDDELRALRGRKEWRRALAAHLLGEMGSDSAVAPLVGALQDGSTDVRSAAARSLGRLEAVAAVEPLVHQLAARHVPHMVAFKALLDIGTDGLGRLRPLIGADDPEVRAVAIELIGCVGEPADAGVLVGLTSDPAPEVRGMAARALSRLGGAEAAGALRGLLLDPVEEVRADAATSLGLIGDLGAIDVLLDSARRGEFEAARSAARAAAAMAPDRVVAEAGGPDPGPHLLEAADRIEHGLR